MTGRGGERKSKKGANDRKSRGGRGWEREKRLYWS